MPRFTRLSDGGRDMNASTNFAKPRPLGHNSGQKWASFPSRQNQSSPLISTCFKTLGTRAAIAAGIGGVTVWQLHIMTLSNLSTVWGPCNCPTWQTYEDLNTNPRHQYGLNILQTDLYLFIPENLCRFQVNLMFKILTASTDFPLFTSNMQTTFWLLVNQCTLVPLTYW